LDCLCGWARMGLLGDCGKTCKDLLSKDFDENTKVTVTTTSADGIKCVAKGTKAGEKVTGEVSVEGTGRGVKGEVKVTTGNKVSVTVTKAGISLGSGATGDVVIAGDIPDRNSGKATFKYRSSPVDFNLKCGLNPAPSVELEAGAKVTKAILAGCEAKYNTSDAQLVKLDGGVQYTAADFVAAGLLQNMGKVVKCNYHHKVNGDTQVGTEIVYNIKESSTKGMAVGVQHKIDSDSTAKAVLNSKGMLNLMYKQQIQPRTCFILTGAVDTKALEKSAKLGLALDFKA